MRQDEMIAQFTIMYYSTVDCSVNYEGALGGANTLGCYNFRVLCLLSSV